MLLSPTPLDYFISYLTEIQFPTQSYNHYLSTRNIYYGVLQYSVMGLLILLVYIIKLKNIITNFTIIIFEYQIMLLLFNYILTISNR